MTVELHATRDALMRGLLKPDAALAEVGRAERIIQAARALTAKPFWSLSQRDFYRVREALDELDEQTPAGGGRGSSDGRAPLANGEAAGSSPVPGLAGDVPRPPAGVCSCGVHGDCGDHSDCLRVEDRFGHEVRNCVRLGGAA